MFKTFARTTAALAVSAAALIAVTRVDAIAAKKTAAPDTDSTEAKPAPSSRRKSDAPKPAPSAPKLTTASLSKEHAVYPEAGETTDSDAANVKVPDWKGKRLSVVRREARKLGLTVVATDGIGDSIAAEEASTFRVRKQLTEAGTEVAPGANVQVKVRMIVDTSEGY